MRNYICTYFMEVEAAMTAMTNMLCHCSARIMCSHHKIAAH